MQIDVFSDPICPWCYIGKTNFERAIATYQGEAPDIQLKWRMFRLNPLMPSHGMDRRAYLERKFGGPEGAKQVYGRIEAAGAAVGITFKFGKIQRTPNTNRAHQLIHHASKTGRDSALNAALFEAYFERGQDIGDKGVLTDEAVALGFDRGDISGLLNSDLYLNQLEQDEASARRAGVSGVPFFLFFGKHGLSGAQPEKAFHHIFDMLNAGDFTEDHVPSPPE